MSDYITEAGEHYAPRNIMEQGEHYTNHISAMTGEGLYTKSDIAAELAHRDIRIAQLEKERDELKAHCEGFRSLYDRFGNDGFEDVQLIEEFGNVACSVPIQSLNEIKAQAVEDAADNCELITGRSALREYANKLREDGR